jgi:hypothetical protein
MRVCARVRAVLSSKLAAYYVRRYPLYHNVLYYIYICNTIHDLYIARRDDCCAPCASSHMCAPIAPISRALSRQPYDCARVSLSRRLASSLAGGAARGSRPASRTTYIMVAQVLCSRSRASIERSSEQPKKTIHTCIYNYIYIYCVMYL